MKNQHNRPTAPQSGGILMRGTRTHHSRKRPTAKRQRQSWRRQLDD